jgi:PAS domain S-box-containing protein
LRPGRERGGLESAGRRRGEDAPRVKSAGDIRRGWPPVALIVCAYLTAFLALDALTHAFEELPGVVAWYPPAGLSYGLLLVFGVRFAPAVAAASLISSLFIYRMPQPAYGLLLWALTASVIYCAAAALLRHRIRFDWRLRTLRDVATLVLTTILVSAVLAAISVLGSALSSGMPRNEILGAVFDWWIGETVGVLSVAPFLLAYVMPGLQRFAQGERIVTAARRPLPRPTLSVLGQGFSLVLTLYWVFGAPVPSAFRPMYLLAVPLIWIALRDGFKRATAGMLVLNSGVMLATWLFGFDFTRLGELELLMIVVSVVGLTLGAVVTERRQAEAALQKSEEGFRALIENAVDLIIVLDADGATTYVSPSMERMLGYEPGEVVGRSFTDLIHPEDLSAGLQVTALRLQATGLADQPSMLRVQHKDASFRTIEVISNNLLDDPALNMIVVNARDITGRLEAEGERRELEARLRQAEKMEAVGRLAGGVAHDFNNMLGVILGHAEMAIAEVDLAQPLGQDLAEIRMAAERSADLTRQLLAFARKQTVAPLVLDLNETVAGMLVMLERLIGEGIHLSWRPGPDLALVSVDPSQIDQILANLCINARDAIVDIGQVTIETSNIVLDAAYCARRPGSVPGEYVRLAVSDDGRGMDEDTLAQLFEPFFTTKGVGKGTGLGLATVYGIVKQNNGSVDVWSEPGQGTTFAIYLPRQEGKAERARAGSPTCPAARGHETILLVEDEQAILDLTARMLERQGYTVLPARTAGDAIRLARDRGDELSLLMTDVVMPDMDGRRLAETLRSFRPDLKRLFMSGYTADVIAHHGVLDEGVFFIQKPFSMKDLTAKVRQALDSES